MDDVVNIFFIALTFFISMVDIIFWQKKVGGVGDLLNEYGLARKKGLTLLSGPDFLVSRVGVEPTTT